MGGEIDAEARAMQVQGFNGDFVLPRDSRTFVTNRVDSIAPYFSKLNAAPAEFCVKSEPRFKSFRHARTVFGKTVLEAFDLNCDGWQEANSPRPYKSEIFVLVPRRGLIEVAQGSERLRVTAGQIAVMPSRGGMTAKRWHDASQLYVVSVSRSTIAQAAAEAYGASRTNLEFEPRIFEQDARVRALQRHIASLYQDAAEAEPCIAEPGMARALERALAHLLLSSFVGNREPRAAHAASPASPYYVRRVLDFVQANPGRGVTAADMQAVAGVSPRALYYGFRQFLGVTPMQYVKQVRLDVARAALVKGRETRTSITSVALDAGYTNLSQFCRDYRRRFGESPSGTLRA